MYSKEFTTCPYEDKENCFARSHSGLSGEVTNKCTALLNTVFAHGCPFYKTKEEFVNGLRIYGGFKSYNERR